jgi:hypothetical protein
MQFAYALGQRQGGVLVLVLVLLALGFSKMETTKK